MDFYTRSKAIFEADEERLRRLAVAGDPDALRDVQRQDARAGWVGETVLWAMRKVIYEQATVLGYRVVREEARSPRRETPFSAQPPLFELHYPGPKFPGITGLEQGLEVNVTLAGYPTEERPRSLTPEVWPELPRHPIMGREVDQTAFFEWSTAVFQETSESVFLPYTAQDLSRAMRDLQRRLKDLPDEVTDYLRYH